VFRADGSYQRSISSPGLLSKGSLSDICVGPTDSYLYITDAADDHIYAIHPTARDMKTPPAGQHAQVIRKWGGTGSTSGLFKRPSGICVVPNGGGQLIFVGMYPSLIFICHLRICFIYIIACCC
jgi:hypothetical protein